LADLSQPATFIVRSRSEANRTCCGHRIPGVLGPSRHFVAKQTFGRFEAKRIRNGRKDLLDRSKMILRRKSMFWQWYALHCKGGDLVSGPPGYVSNATPY